MGYGSGGPPRVARNPREVSAQGVRWNQVRTSSSNFCCCCFPLQNEPSGFTFMLGFFFAKATRRLSHAKSVQLTAVYFFAGYLV